MSAATMFCFPSTRTGCFVLVAVLPLLPSCHRELGPDPELPGHGADAGTSLAPPAPGQARAPLDAQYFFCRVQPEVITAHRCASDDGCHTDRSALRLDPVAERLEAPPCDGTVPPASFYTNLARCRAEVRSTAQASDLYRRPLGRSHPVTLFDAASAEAEVLRAWIEGSP